MYGFGWRRRIGCFSPAVMELIPYDFYRFAPDGIGFVGVTANTDSWSKEDIDKSLNAALESSTYLAGRGVDYIVHTGAAHVASRGKGYDREFLQALQARSGVPATTSIRSAIDAMTQLGLRKIAIASPWPEATTQWVADYVMGEGIDVMRVECVGTDFKALHQLNPGVIYRFALNLARKVPEADGIYIPGPQAPAAEIVDTLERDIGKPVLASTPTDFWAAFKALGLRDRIEGHGRLLASLACD